MKRLLSLFDHTGEWSRPFRQADWDVIQLDLKHGNDVSEFTCEFIIENYLGNGTIDGVIMAPPCTEFTNSGARWWDAKDSDGRTDAAAELVRQGIRTIEFLKPDWWALENPPGRLAKIVPELNTCDTFLFDPCDFAGYIPTNEFQETYLAWITEAANREDWENINANDAEMTRFYNRYTKKTKLWGHFPEPVKDRREPIKVCSAGSWIMKLGGKSEATKAARSATPAGFSRAFYEAVKDYSLDWEAIDNGEADYHSFQDDEEIPPANEAPSGQLEFCFV